MASFELGKEIEKYVFSPPKDSIFSLSNARDNTKKYLSLFLYRAENFTSLLFYLQKFTSLRLCSLITQSSCQRNVLKK